MSTLDDTYKLAAEKTKKKKLHWSLRAAAGVGAVGAGYLTYRAFKDLGEARTKRQRAERKAERAILRARQGMAGVRRRQAANTRSYRTAMRALGVLERVTKRMR